jgi:hypothetical protein
LRDPLNPFPNQFPDRSTSNDSNPDNLNPDNLNPDNLNPATVNPSIHANTNTTGNDASLRRIARMTARLLRAKSAIITLLDGTQIRYGLEGSLESSQATFLEPGFAPTGEVMTVSDLSAFLRHREHPLVKGGKARFLVHMALESNVQTPGKVIGTQVIGTLCVLDPKPREGLNRSEHAVLNEFATLIVDWLEIKAELAKAKEMALENDDVPLVIEPAIDANMPYSAAQTVHTPTSSPASSPASSELSAGFSGAVPDDIAPWMLAPWMQPQSENKNEAHAGALEGSTLTVLAVNNDAEITLLAGRAHPDLGLLNHARGQRLNEICPNNALIDTVRRALEGERVTTRLNANLEVHAAPNLDVRLARRQCCSSRCQRRTPTRSRLPKANPHDSSQLLRSKLFRARPFKLERIKLEHSSRIMNSKTLPSPSSTPRSAWRSWRSMGKSYAATADCTRSWGMKTKPSSKS